MHSSSSGAKVQVAYTSLPPGPAVGTIREALLQAQIAGEVTDRDSAITFVKNYAAKLK